MYSYSFKDLAGAFYHSLAGAYTLSGQVGVGQISIAMSTEKTATDVSADGTVQVSYVAGDNGVVTIECLQTSATHKFLLKWFNMVNAAAKNGDISTWAGAYLTFRSTNDQTGHICSGGSPAKIPDKTYAAQGGKVTWSIPFADIQSATY